MVRLIDADVLERAVQASIAEYADVYTGEMIFGMRSVVFYATNGAPTVDAVPVVRCKDCLFSTCIEEKDDWWECEHDHRVNHGNGFCNWAERKEE